MDSRTGVAALGKQLVRTTVGAAADHRIAVAAVQSGARDYFSLPADFDLLRRSLERLSRDTESRAQAAEFAEAERRARETVADADRRAREAVADAEERLDRIRIEREAVAAYLENVRGVLTQADGSSSDEASRTAR